jgi:hypothetical protein
MLPSRLDLYFQPSSRLTTHRMLVGIKAYESKINTIGVSTGLRIGSINSFGSSGDVVFVLPEGLKPAKVASDW